MELKPPTENVKQTTFYPDLSEVRIETSFVLKENIGANPSKSILDALLQIPPDFEKAGHLLKESSLSASEISELAAKYAEECWCEDDYGDSFEELEPDNGYYWREPTVIPGLHSTYLYEVIRFLLDYGLDPNYSREGNWGLLEWVINTVNGYIAADTLALLLDHGGNPNLELDGELLFDKIDFNVGFDAIEMCNRRRYESYVHCWMVLIGYGGTPSDGTTPLDVMDEYLYNSREEFDITKLKNHRNYTFGITHIVNRGSAPTIHIFDRRTLWEVARI